MNSLVGVLATPAVATALQLAGRAAEATSESFASVMEIAAGRNGLPISADIPADDALEPELASGASDLIDSALEGLHGILAAVGL